MKAGLRKRGSIFVNGRNLGQTSTLFTNVLLLEDLITAALENGFVNIVANFDKVFSRVYHL